MCLTRPTNQCSGLLDPGFTVCLWLRFGSGASGWSSDISEAFSLGFGGNLMLKHVIIHEDG